MFDKLSFAEVEAQQVELLPARTVLSLFTTGTPGKPGSSTPGSGSSFFPTGFCMLPGITCSATAGMATPGAGGAAGTP